MLPNGAFNEAAQAAIFRGITRALMVVSVVDIYSPSGFFGWANEIELSEAKTFDQVAEADKRAKEAREKSAKNLRDAIDAVPTNISILSNALAVGRRLLKDSELIGEAEAKLKPILLAELKKGIDRKEINVLQTAVSAAEALTTTASALSTEELEKARQALHKQQEAVITEKLKTALKANEISLLESVLAEANALLSFEPRHLQSARDALWKLKKTATVKALMSAKSGKNVNDLKSAINAARALIPAFDDDLLLTSSESLLRELEVQQLEIQLGSALALKDEDGVWAALRDQQRVAWFCAGSDGAARVKEAWAFLSSTVVTRLELAIASENAEIIWRSLSSLKRIPDHNTDALEQLQDKAYAFLRDSKKATATVSKKNLQNIWDPSGNDAIVNKQVFNLLNLNKLTIY